MLFMVIERFKNCDAKAVYERFLKEGRKMPDALVYKESWVEANFKRCFQLMECEDVDSLQKWVLHWQDLVEFEFVPVIESGKTLEIVKSLL
jgi:hypothetical protein